MRGGSCPGWNPIRDGSDPGRCGKPTGKGLLWCPEHEQQRREHIDRQFKKISTLFEGGS